MLRYGKKAMRKDHRNVSDDVWGDVSRLFDEIKENIQFVELFLEQPEVNEEIENNPNQK